MTKILSPQTIQSDGLLDLGNWTFLKNVADLAKFSKRLTGLYEKPVIASYPVLVMCFVSGACDDSFDWVIITIDDAAGILSFLTFAHRLFADLDKPHVP